METRLEETITKHANCISIILGLVSFATNMTVNYAREFEAREKAETKLETVRGLYQNSLKHFSSYTSWSPNPIENLDN